MDRYMQHTIPALPCCHKVHPPSLPLCSLAGCAGKLKKRVCACREMYVCFPNIDNLSSWPMSMSCFSICRQQFCEVWNIADSKNANIAIIAVLHSPSIFICP